jgi:hypothetical protein
MTNKLHQYCKWSGDGKDYLVVGNYVHPYHKTEYLTLASVEYDEETGMPWPDNNYPTTISTEDELTFTGEGNAIYNK